MTLRLHTFDARHSRRICSWVTDLSEAQVWAGRKMSFPVDPDVFGQWHADADVHPYLASWKKDVVAYGEIWGEGDECELARIIVAPESRGRGIGRSFVESLCEQASQTGHTRVFMRVVPTNTVALRCYEQAHFTRVSDQEEAHFNQRQPVNYVWLERWVGT